jgi:putative endonuclease
MVVAGQYGGKFTNFSPCNGWFSIELRTDPCSGNMAEHLQTGAAGEQLACQYLADLGFTLLHRNWRHGRDELDIVARDGKELVVVEVKTRSNSDYGDPEDAVGPAKQRKMFRAAEAYLDVHDLDLDLRFDIVSITMDGGRPNIRHIAEAFTHTPQDEEADE